MRADFGLEPIKLCYLIASKFFRFARQYIFNVPVHHIGYGVFFGFAGFKVPAFPYCTLSVLHPLLRISEPFKGGGLRGIAF